MIVGMPSALRSLKSVSFGWGAAIKTVVHFAEILDVNIRKGWVRMRF
jgi:hypothetical protein